MGVLVFIGAQIVLYALAWWLVRQAAPDTRSYLIGAAHMATIGVLAVMLPRMYFYFSRRGWTADLGLWKSRVQIELHSDWQAPLSGWDIDVLRVQLYRRRQYGTLCGCVAILGVHLHVGILLDPAEAEAYREGRRQARDAYIASLPPSMQPAVREMMKDVPLEAAIEVGAIPMQRDEDDEDDVPARPRGGVH